MLTLSVDSTHIRKRLPHRSFRSLIMSKIISLRHTLGLKRSTLVATIVVVSCTSLILIIGLMDVSGPSMRTSFRSRGTVKYVSAAQYAECIRLLGTHTFRSNDTRYRRRTPACNVSNLTVLGRPLDRCATLEVANLAQEEDIYVSVKTSYKNHVSRMLPVLLTWFQTLHPQQVTFTEFNNVI